MQDITDQYVSKFKKLTPHEKLGEIHDLVRRGLPHAMAIGLIILITRK